MADMYVNEEKAERVILVAVDTGEYMSSMYTVEDSLAELAELARTAGAEVAGRMVQNLPAFDASGYLGRGKLEELARLADELDASGVIVDDELSNAQMSGMTEALDCKVMDRTMLILDIFACHARSAEGMLQVELAQLNYRLTKLTGRGTAMSRLGGGIGTRGPGEKKLEVDRRRIRSRIAHLRRELDEIKSHRDLTGRSRRENNCVTFGIVGYTNVGKSTMLNALTGADILAEDKLFATLDTTTRKYTYRRENGSGEVLLTDTVGFIRKLPHQLIEAFHSTLMEVEYADHIIHVVDASRPSFEEEMNLVYDTLEDLGIRGKKILTVFNKMDKYEGDESELRDIRADEVIKISAATGRGMEQIPEAIERILQSRRVEIRGMIPFDKMALLNEIRKRGSVAEEEYTEAGVRIRAMVDERLAAKLIDV